MNVYSVSDIAKKYEVSNEAVRVWIRKGLLKAQKISSGYIILEEDLLQFNKPVMGRPYESDSQDEPDR